MTTDSATSPTPASPPTPTPRKRARDVGAGESKGDAAEPSRLPTHDDKRKRKETLYATFKVTEALLDKVRARTKELEGGESEWTDGDTKLVRKIARLEIQNSVQARMRHTLRKEARTLAHRGAMQGSVKAANAFFELHKVDMHPGYEQFKDVAIKYLENEDVPDAFDMLMMELCTSWESDDDKDWVTDDVKQCIGDLYRKRKGEGFTGHMWETIHFASMPHGPAVKAFRLFLDCISAGSGSTK